MPNPAGVVNERLAPAVITSFFVSSNGSRLDVCCRLRERGQGGASYDLMLGKRSDDAELGCALTLQRVGLIDPFDELRPSFSESGALSGENLDR